MCVWCVYVDVQKLSREFELGLGFVVIVTYSTLLISNSSSVILCLCRGPRGSPPTPCNVPVPPSDFGFPMCLHNRRDLSYAPAYLPAVDF